MIKVSATDDEVARKSPELFQCLRLIPLTTDALPLPDVEEVLKPLRDASEAEAAEARRVAEEGEARRLRERKYAVDASALQLRNDEIAENERIKQEARAATATSTAQKPTKRNPTAF